MTSAVRMVREHLLADAGVMAETDHVFAVRAQQSKPPPYIIVGLVGEEEWLRALAGASGQYEARVSVACHATNAAAADTMAETVKAALADFAGDVFTTESPAVRLGSLECWMAGASVFDWSDDGSVFRRIVDFGIRWRP